MSDKENLIKLQELTAAAVELVEELEDIEAKVKTFSTQAALTRENLVEVKKAICGLSASIVETPPSPLRSTPQE